jgi:hypothetical protein
MAEIQKAPDDEVRFSKTDQMVFAGLVALAILNASACVAFVLLSTVYR